VPGGKSTTSGTSSACRGAFVTSNRDFSATTVRSPTLRAVWPKAERLAAVVIARIKLRSHHVTSWKDWNHSLNRAITIVVQALFELGKLTAPRHLHLELATAAADDRTIGIGRIEGR